MGKEFILMSGGLDSTTLAYHLKNEKKINIEGLFMDYGQPTSSEELKTVRDIGNDLQINIRRVDLSTIWSNFENEGLDPYAAACTETANIFAPILLAATFAYAAGSTKLYSAFHATDVQLFSSTVPVLKSQEKIMEEVSKKKGVNFQYALPFINYSKAQVIEIGHSLKVPFEKTLTCLNNDKTSEGHCGECNPCKTRRKAFKEANIFDKTNYAK
ncbi:7-cyano-7-deazaguanine synthase [Aureibaculum conchae]|uniref:7-cyano-7-deazaguanine synthase n=1 Tax=Aureibaculum sp. 2308TA14-22 TaxID=3108392 RepID=UPI003391B37B